MHHLSTSKSSFDTTAGSQEMPPISSPCFGAIAPNLAILDPLNAQSDPALFTLKAAVNPEEVLQQFQQLYHNAEAEGSLPFRSLPHELASDCEAQPQILKRIWICRHKPGRRCLVEYRWIDPDAPGWSYDVLGKIRAKGLDRRSYEIQRALWFSGFDDQSLDEISVPEPLGLFADFNQWVQRRIPGTEVTEILPGPSGMLLARQMAKALHKLHQTPLDGQHLSPQRGHRTSLPSLWPQLQQHDLGVEFRVLHQQLRRLAQRHPEWEPRILALWEQCHRLGYRLDWDLSPGPSGLIHRDFSADQVLRMGQRLYFLDLDLACLGDPAVDVGNFLGYLIEQGVRTLGYALALKPVGDRFLKSFLDLQTPQMTPAQLTALRQRIAIYTSLTLVRHLALGDRLPSRQLFTADLLRLCEQRLAEQVTIGRHRDRWDVGLAQ